MSIVDFFMDQRQVDSIKLSILLEHLAAELDTARKAALETNTREQWDAEVLPRLSFPGRDARAHRSHPARHGRAAKQVKSEMRPC
jgi:chromosome condensin MukBEF complex kleisin-like MukF subunit